MPEQPVEMNVTLSEGTRRLPVYLLLDCSSSMTGTPIEAVKAGVDRFAQEVRSDAYAAEAVHFALIAFDSGARMLTEGLESIESFQPPDLRASGTTNLAQALELLNESLDRDIRQSVTGGEIGDWKPLVFILTDAWPDSGWEASRQKLLDRTNRRLLNVITVGCGPNVNAEQLKAISLGATFHMENQDEQSYREFFDYMSQSVQRVSTRAGEADAGGSAVDMPKPPDGIQYIP